MTDMPHETIRVLSIGGSLSDAGLIQEMLDEATALGRGLPHFKLIGVTSLADGLEYLAQGGIDVVLSDLDLPDSQTGDAFPRLRAHAAQVEYPGPPIVVLTGCEDEGLARRTVRAGAEDYIFKREMSGSLLAHALLYAIERRSANEELARAHGDLEQQVQERTAELRQANEQLRQEIVDRQQVERALRESENNLRLAQKLAHVGSWQIDLSAGQVVGSEEAHRIYGLGEGTWTIADIQAIPLPEYRAMLDTALRQLVVMGQAYNVEFRVRRPTDGAVRDIRSVAEYDGERNLVIGTLQDITERKSAEMALQESEEKYRSLFNQSAWGIHLHEVDGRIIDVNQMACLQSGYSREEMLQLTVFDLHPNTPDTRNMPKDEILRQWNEWQPGQRFTLEVEHLCKDGSIIPVEISTGAVRYGDKKLILALLQDITERRQAAAERERLQAQLAQAQRMEAVGRLAGGVAHDFNNMLGVIIGRAELAMQQIGSSHPLHGDLTEIHQAAQRSADLTRQLLAFARKQIIKPVVLDVNNTVSSILKMLRRLIGEGIELAWIPGAGLWPAKIDPGQFDQILINLCINARDAIGEVGKITIETRNVVCDESYRVGRPWFVPGEYVQLVVSDDGCGMTEEVQANLFEPYFTTKVEGQSGGLGLATVYGAVKQNRGFIHIYSEPNLGTTVSIYLPRSSGPAVAVETTRPGVMGGRETVLVVEDEPAILRLTRIVLEQLGYTVLTASQPGEALRLAREYAGELDLLITDVVMPEMNGRDLFTRMGAIHPNLRCLFISGYTANVIANRGVLEEGVWFLQKPFAIDELARQVRKVLGAAGGQTDPA